MSEKEMELPGFSQRCEVTLIETKDDDGSRTLKARVDPQGQIVLDGYDTGRTVEEMWGKDEYEYTLTVYDSYRDTVTLRLIQERFKNAAEFRTWLESHKIPLKWESW